VNRLVHLEVLVEDRSGKMFLDPLLRRLLAGVGRDVEVAIRPHRGKGRLPADPSARPDRFASGLMDLLPARMRAYSAVFAPGTHGIVVVLDSDEEDPETVRTRIDRLSRPYRNGLPVVIGISVEEMESWMLADRAAILSAFPRADPRVLDAYSQDSVCGTWELLARAILGDEAEDLIELGYPAVGRYKAEWATRIGVHADPDRIRSPSFLRFRRDLDRLLETGAPTA